MPFTDAALRNPALGFAFGSTLSLDGLTRTFSFGGFIPFNGATSGIVDTRVGPLTYPTSRTFARQKLQAASISVVLKTAFLWKDDQRFHLRFALTDAAGRPQIDTSSMAVTVVFTNPVTSTTTSRSCRVPSTDSGVESCKFSSLGIDDFFSTTQDNVASAFVTVTYGSVEACRSNTVAITLKRSVFTNVVSNTAAGMELQVPTGELFPGEIVRLVITVSTGSTNLVTWGLRITYDPTLLTFDGQAKLNNDFDTPVANTATVGVVTMTSNVVTGRTVSGSNLLLVQVTLVVNSNAPVGVRSNVLSMVVTDMVNTAGNKYVENQPASILDARGRTGAANAQLTIRSVLRMGMYAFATRSEFVNTLALTNSQASVSAPIQVFAVDNVFDNSDSAAVATCQVSPVFDSVVSVSGCVAQITRQHTLGASQVPVTITLDTLTYSLNLRVWNAANIQIAPESATLSRLPLTECSPEYMRARVKVTCDMQAPTLEPLRNVDVTNLVSFSTTSGNNRVISTTTSSNGIVTVTGVGQGQDSLTIQTTLPVSPVLITVSDVAASVTSLHVALVTSVQLTSQGTTSVSPNTNPISVPVQLAHQLTREGNSGQVFVFATFDNGLEMDVTAHPGVAVTSTAGQSLLINRAQDLSWTGSVGVGGVSQCGNALKAQWSVCTNVPTLEQIVERLRNTDSILNILNDNGIGVDTVTGDNPVISARATPSETPTQTTTPTSSASRTATQTSTPTSTATRTGSATQTSTSSASKSVTNTATSTQTSTNSKTP